MLNRKILIVEDSHDYRELMSRFYSDEGFEVATAKNGEEGLRMLAEMEDLPAFILLDFEMPVMGGSDFRAEQLKIPRLAAIPVVLITADSKIDEKGAEISADSKLKKPASLKELRDLARRYCS